MSRVTPVELLSPPLHPTASSSPHSPTIMQSQPPAFTVTAPAHVQPAYTYRSLPSPTAGTSRQTLNVEAQLQQQQQQQQQQQPLNALLQQPPSPTVASMTRSRRSPLARSQTLADVNSTSRNRSPISPTAQSGKRKTSVDMPRLPPQHQHQTSMQLQVPILQYNAPPTQHVISPSLSTIPYNGNGFINTPTTSTAGGTATTTPYVQMPRSPSAKQLSPPVGGHFHSNSMSTQQQMDAAALHAAASLAASNSNGQFQYTPPTSATVQAMQVAAKQMQLQQHHSMYAPPPSQQTPVQTTPLKRMASTRSLKRNSNIVTDPAALYLIQQHLQQQQTSMYYSGGGGGGGQYSHPSQNGNNNDNAVFSHPANSQYQPAPVSRNRPPSHTRRASAYNYNQQSPMQKAPTANNLSRYSSHAASSANQMPGISGDTDADDTDPSLSVGKAGMPVIEVVDAESANTGCSSLVFGIPLWALAAAGTGVAAGYIYYAYEAISWILTNVENDNDDCIGSLAFAFAICSAALLSLSHIIALYVGARFHARGPWLSRGAVGIDLLSVAMLIFGYVSAQRQDICDDGSFITLSVIAWAMHWGGSILLINIWQFWRQSLFIEHRKQLEGGSYAPGPSMQPQYQPQPMQSQYQQSYISYVQ